MSAADDASGSRITRYLGIAAIAAVGLGFAGYRFGAPGVVLGIAALTLVAAIASFWGSLRTLLGETRLTGADAYAIGAPRVEEEQKRSVLRALKDLEFERSVGKISDDDYKVLVASYRKEAKRLLRLLDEATAEQRERAEKIVDARLAELGIKRQEPPATEPADAAETATTEAAKTEAVAEAEEKAEEKAEPEETKGEAAKGETGG